MNWDKLVEESVGGLTIYAIFRTSMTAVEAGKGSEAQKRLVDSLMEVLTEYKNQAVLEKMQAEAADLVRRQKAFQTKWGMTNHQEMGVKSNGCNQIPTV